MILSSKAGEATAAYLIASGRILSRPGALPHSMLQTALSAPRYQKVLHLFPYTPLANYWIPS